MSTVREFAAAAGLGEDMTEALLRFEQTQDAKREDLREVDCGVRALTSIVVAVMWTAFAANRGDVSREAALKVAGLLEAGGNTLDRAMMGRATGGADPPDLGQTALEPCRGERACPYGRPYDGCEGRQRRGVCPHFGQRVLWMASGFGGSERRWCHGHGTTPGAAVLDLRRRMGVTEHEPH